MRALGLLDAAANGVFHQLLMPVAPGPPVIKLRDGLPGLVVAVGVHGAERAGASARGPMAGGLAVGNGHALAALDQGQNVNAAHADRIDRLHGSYASPSYPGGQPRRNAGM